MFEGEGTPSEDDGKTCTCKQRIVLMRANAHLEKEIKELKTILCRAYAICNEFELLYHSLFEICQVVCPIVLLPHFTAPVQHCNLKCNCLHRVKALLNELPVNSSPISSLHSLKSPSSSPTMETFNPCIVSTQIDDASAHPRSPILGAQKRRPAKPVVDLDETYFEPAEKAKASAGRSSTELRDWVRKRFKHALAIGGYTTPQRHLQVNRSPELVMVYEF
ncbi:hypothetical protein ONE63_011497 [Megalurothrips usitatus]|uniref:Uncharacterized protein n=1 Tax=Megalurothrips usitatus TaxID=439358 RepID=A0AAV7X4E9_9NEOP|nr:hypothetical protein ONE63_011497 [Megalurothrips usitatus]